MSRAPRRTCVTCREGDQPDSLVRLVRAPDDTVVPDLAAKLPGRGAWVHPRPECVEGAPARLARAFKSRVDASQLEERLRAAIDAALVSGLSLAAAGGGVVGGRSAVEQALAEERATHVLLAADAAERTVRAIETAARDVPTLRLARSTDELGHLTGKAPRAVLAVLDTASSVHLRRQLRRLRSLG
jgi:predicted RNA-binding protein YlxR (DUF448 family)